MSTYDVAYKKKGEPIWWFKVSADNEKNARKKAEDHVKGTKGYHLYAGPLLVKS